VSREQVWLVQHLHALSDGSEDVKFGVYSTQARAPEAIGLRAKAPGFCDSPDGFHIDEYVLDKDHWVQGFSSLVSA
jgi:hypothetical protein